MIDSLFTEYQKFNFSDPRNKYFNDNKNLYIGKILDDSPFEPYEVVFIKYSDLEYLKDAKERVKLYQRWIKETKIFNRTRW